MAKLFLFDLVTSGKNYRKHSILSMTFKIIIDNRVREQVNFLLKTDNTTLFDIERKTDENVCRILSLDDEIKKDQKIVFIELKRILTKYVNIYKKENERFYLFGYNIGEYKNDFLKSFFYKNAEDEKSRKYFNYYYSYFYDNSIDISVLASQKLIKKRHDIDKFTKQNVCKLLNIEINEEEKQNEFYQLDISNRIYKEVKFIFEDDI